MVVNKRVRELMENRGTTDAIKEAAVDSGMSTLRDNCVKLVIDGVITTDELFRLTYNVE